MEGEVAKLQTRAKLNELNSQNLYSSAFPFHLSLEQKAGPTQPPVAAHSCVPSRMQSQSRQGALGWVWNLCSPHSWWVIGSGDPGRIPSGFRFSRSSSWPQAVPCTGTGQVMGCSIVPP